MSREIGEVKMFEIFSFFFLTLVFSLFGTLAGLMMDEIIDGIGGEGFLVPIILMAGVISAMLVWIVGLR